MNDATKLKKNTKMTLDGSNTSINKQNVELYEFYVKKLNYYNDVISNVIIDIDVKIKNKYITGNDGVNCVAECREISMKINECFLFLESIQLQNTNTNTASAYLQDNIYRLQEINDLLNKVIKSYGCNSVEQVIVVCFGNDFYTSLQEEEGNKKQVLLNKYFHPTSFKCFNWKEDKKNNKYLPRNKIIEDCHIVECGQNFECFDFSRATRFYKHKINGIKVVYQNPVIKRTLIITGYVDVNVDLKCLDNEFITTLMAKLRKSKSLDIDVSKPSYKNFVDMLSLKECLVYSIDELYKMYIGFVNQYEVSKSKPLSQVVNEFMTMEIVSQIRFIKTLIIHHYETNAYYLCGILFSLLNEDRDGVIVNTLQEIIYEALSFECQYYLRKMKNNYNDKSTIHKKFNTNKIPYEHQIEMMPVCDDIKEKAFLKLKEVASKSEESGTKARNYLDGLLKIPFGVYKEEPVLKSKEELGSLYRELLCHLFLFLDILKEAGVQVSNTNELSKLIPDKIDDEDAVNNCGIQKELVNFNTMKNICNNFNNHMTSLLKNSLETICSTLSRFDVKKKIDDYNLMIKSIKLKYKTNPYSKNIERVKTTGKKKGEMLSLFLIVFENNLKVIKQFNYDDYVTEKVISPLSFGKNALFSLTSVFKSIDKLKQYMLVVNERRGKSLENIEKCVYGHNNAKKQIKNIINQWITGDKNGYCFGFEGPPGVGKTSMAKIGLAKCLEDENGVFRPFDFIALGGSSNGSYLSGHSYTYLGSSWGRVVDILISKKCMNPIIFIDELDKVSNSEYGKEITGILTHLVDSSQNTNFQDKYFSGIDIDLSKALFVFSYNDPSKVDPILLDRIHRIKFDNLTPFDKLVICNDFIIPETNKKYGFSDDFIKISDSAILFLIDNFTYESGVRKLKQLLFEIWGDINEMMLNGDIETPSFMVSEDNIENVFLKEKHKISKIKTPLDAKVGIINGLWANNVGLGGVTPIQVKWFPSKTPLELKLTGMQGDVMKESMNVAKTLAWNLLLPQEQTALWAIIYNSEGLCRGLHIHCPEGAVNKDGPSAGGAITTCLLSIFKNKVIDNKYAMTGEINLSGAITAIGGLEQKLYYGICAGATKFAFPKANKKDFELFKCRYADKIKDFDKIEFYTIEHIDDASKLAFFV